jgi:hypothetical protein
MPNPALEAFKKSLQERGVMPAVDLHLMDRIPFVFNEDWELFRDWKRKLGGLLEVDPRNITLVGSAATGFSLNPHKSFREFGDHSDIDVAIISEFHFSASWRALRQTNLSTVTRAKERQAVIEHRERHIYFGCIAADKVMSLLPFKIPWTEAMSAMAGEAPTEEREIKLRIYRDYDALRSYHLQGMETMKTAVLVA